VFGQSDQSGARLAIAQKQHRAILQASDQIGQLFLSF
jgi:hypothetical protein